MSILVVEVLSEGIIFGADRNITYTDVNGSTTQGTSRSKVFKWPAERFLFGFVGAATVGGLPMDEWLDSIKDEFASKTSLEEIAQKIHQKIQLQRAEDEGINPAKGLIIHLGGFERRNDIWLPFVWHISNAYKLGKFGYLPDFRKTFVCSEAFWNWAKPYEIDPSEVRRILRVMEKQFNPCWFHQGIDLCTFNALESAIKSTFKLLCQQHPEHEIPTTIEEWAKHIRMQILMYGAYFEAFRPEGQRYVGGSGDIVFTPWPE